MDFVETVSLILPDNTRELASFREGNFAESHGLVVEVAAIHEGSTQNFNFYAAKELKKSVETWTSPYQKPLLRHHDPYSEAIGRVIGARMAHEADGSPFIMLQVAVTDTEAIEKVGDERYLTGSVGGRAGRALCSVCKVDWANASMFSIPCDHQRGKKYESTVAQLLIEDITWKEYSFVNMPADGRSGVRGTKPADKASKEDATVRFFCLDFAEERVADLSAPGKNLLESFVPAEASVLYVGLRDAFFAAVESTKAATDNKESSMADAPEETVGLADEGDDDVLAAVEGLAADPPAEATEADEETPEETTEGADSETGDATIEGETSETAEEVPGDAPAEESETPPGETPGETPAEVPEQTTPPAPVETEVPVEEAEAEATETEEPTEADAPAQEATPDPEPDPELARLADENARLRVALKRNLAERVVDVKIALALCESDDRDAQVASHLERSATSLADTLRDLATMPATRHPLEGVPKVQSTQAALEGDSEREIDVEVVESNPSPKTPDPEDVLVDVFMGRRSL